MTHTGTGKYEQALIRCRDLDPIPTAVAHPCDETSLAGAFEAKANRLITPILVGPEKKIRDVADRHGIDLGGTRIVDATHSHESAAKAVELFAQPEIASIGGEIGGRVKWRRRHNFRRRKRL